MLDSPADVLLEALQGLLQASGGRVQTSELLLDLHSQQVELVLEALDGLLHILTEANGSSETSEPQNQPAYEHSDVLKADKPVNA